ncbi:MAG: TlyA family RNA methyltransferase [Ruminococcus sp.]|nr:TlyA family RNA methyltransferase [Ruminococcus sp.]
MSERLDAYLVRNGLAKSRERAKELIKNGCVQINGRNASKPSATVEDNDIVSSQNDHRYVGRGAFKLIKALDAFGVSLEGRVCADIGASTGGFTQVLLERGATKVYAIDVGHGQLDSALSSDERVINMEGTNVKELDNTSFSEPIGLITADVSFISLTNIIGNAVSILADGGEMILLIKPQFEAGKSALSKGGIVKDKKVHINVIIGLISAFQSAGLNVKGLTASPIMGGSGNIEYLVWLKKEAIAAFSQDITKLVDEAFAGFKER